ncbi:HamA C-terminal domain-containing protein [Kangiella shandongensis]|uniref:HamA C-terminal domain-containing protein n=1 Tax=Kangiella shandongensis TaxID=2763258 RepID=UPI001CBEB90B|nr:DUF1837 domain-containing protein [Kangiella shandongensis]
MRQSLRDLIKNTILLKYKLPNTNLNFSNTKISTEEDSCYTSDNNDKLALLIYNAVIEYAFNEYELSDYDFDTLHRRALTRKLKFNDDATDEQKLKYGFYGEVVLYCMLYIFYGAPPVIARGHLYQVLENGETKGYDAYHLIDNNGTTELWFGEVKFFSQFGSATTGPNGAITNLQKAISDDYLNRNLIAISERTNDLAKGSSSLVPILADIKANPDLKISELSKKHNIKLVYPILILYDEKRGGYDKTIEDSLSHIKNKVGDLSFDTSLDVSLFFIFTPVYGSSVVAD